MFFTDFFPIRKSPSPQQSNSNSSSDKESLPVASSPNKLTLSESLDKSSKKVQGGQRRPKSLTEGGKRRGSVKRVTRKQTGSPIITGNSGDYELIEVVQYEGRSQLPSPFLVWAVQLPFHGSLPRSERGFSLAMWVCFTCPRLGNEFDSGARNANSDSLGWLSSGEERRNLLRNERIVHLCSIGSGKSLFEVWTAPAEGALVVRYIFMGIDKTFAMLSGISGVVFGHLLTTRTFQSSTESLFYIYIYFFPTNAIDTLTTDKKRLALTSTTSERPNGLKD